LAATADDAIVGQRRTPEEGMAVVKTDTDTIVDLYKAYLDDFGRVGSRHETLRGFYLSVVSALFVFLSLGGSEPALLTIRRDVRIVAAVVGILICGSWFMHMWSFGALFKAKRKVLADAEVPFPFKPFTNEATALKGSWRMRLTVIDRWVAAFFIGLFVTVGFLR
jgi:hypothetical protein